MINVYASSEAGGMAISCGQGPGPHLVEEPSAKRDEGLAVYREAPSEPFVPQAGRAP